MIAVAPDTSRPVVAKFVNQVANTRDEVIEISLEKCKLYLHTLY